MQADEALVELTSIIEERASFRDAAYAARKFALQSDCVVTVTRRDAPLHDYWRLMVPNWAMQAQAAQMNEEKKEREEEHRRYLAEKEAEFEERFQRDLDHEAQLNQDNFRGRYGSAFDPAPAYAYDRPDVLQPWDDP